MSGALVGWTLLAIVLWVVTGWLEARDSCETDYELFCLHKGEIWLLLGYFTALLWLGGLLVIALIGALIWSYRRRSSRGRVAA